MAEVIDLTLLDDSSSDEADGPSDAPPSKRPRPAAATTEDDDVAVVEETANDETPAAPADQLQDGEELRITGSHVEVWNQDLPHQRHQCGQNPFVEAGASDNSKACSKCYCFVCDVPSTECHRWGSGLSRAHHCNAHPDSDGFYRALRLVQPAGTPRRADVGLAVGLLDPFNTPASARPAGPASARRPLKQAPRQQLETPYQAPGAPPVVELPAPGGPDMYVLGEIRLPCRLVGSNTCGVSSLAELDAKLLRHGVYCDDSTWKPLPQGTLCVDTLFKRSDCPPSPNDRRPLELLPYQVSLPESVPAQRVLPLTVFRCNGQWGAPKTFGVQTASGNKPCLLSEILASAKLSVPGLSEAEASDDIKLAGGVVFGCPNIRGSALEVRSILTRGRDSAASHAQQQWGSSEPLVLLLPSVPQTCRSAVAAAAPQERVRLVVYIYLDTLFGRQYPKFEDESDCDDDDDMGFLFGLSYGARSLRHLRMRALRARYAAEERKRFQSLGIPVILTVDKDTARGGENATDTVMQAVLAALAPILRPGSEPPAGWKDNMTLSRELPEWGPTGTFERWPNHPCPSEDVDLFACIPSEAADCYDFSSYHSPAADASAAPEVLQASKARAAACRDRDRVQQDAIKAPFDLAQEMIDAQRCSKPYKHTTRHYGRTSTVISQAITPRLRLHVRLEQDSNNDASGTAVFRLWAWKHTSAPTLEVPGHKALMLINGRFGSSLSHFQISNRSLPLPLAMRKLMEGVPGLAEVEAALASQRTSEAKEAITSVPKLLKALEAVEMPPATQPLGLTVTLRPYQLQTLGFMQRAERGEDGLRRHLWFPIPKAPLGSEASGHKQQDAWWWSPVFQVASQIEPEETAWGGFLGETMGLGKTVEVLALILSDKPHLPAIPQRLPVLYPPDHSARQGMPQQSAAEASGPADVQGRLCSNATLVVCAVSLVGQWAAEAQEKAGGALRIYQYHGGSRIRSAAKLALEYDVVVTTYATLGADYGRMKKLPCHAASERERLSPLHAVQWYRLVMDESHCVKDSTANQSKACVALEASRRWCCSGTPISTDVMDLQGQLAALRMSPFSDKQFFVREYRHSLRPSGLGGNGPELMHVLQRIMVRHTGSQTTGGETVLALPPLQPSTVPVSFTTEETLLYKQAHKQAVAAFQAFLSGGNAASAASKNLLAIMSLLLPLRSIASGGQLSASDLALPESSTGGLAGPTVPLPAGEMQCPVCLDAPDAPMRTPCGHWFCKECILGVVDQASTARCPMCRAGVAREGLRAGEQEMSSEPVDAAAVACESKLRALVAELHAMRASDASAKALVFSQFSSTVEWLKVRLPGEGFAFRTIDGSMPMRKRAAAIADFQGDPPTTVFLLSMRAGGVGINLTAASHVFLLEPALNPALEEQAIGRAWRMGQTRPVVVKRMYVLGSVEENIMELNRRRATGEQATGASSAARGSKGLKQQEVAGSLHSDRQNLRLEELNLLFSEPAAANGE